MSATMIVAICLFAVTYVLLIALPKIRAYIALGSAILFIAIGILPIGKVFFAVDWNVIMMIGGTMGIVALFIKSKMPALLADVLIKKTPNVMWSTLALSLFSGIISAFVDNVATVLMVAPVAITIAKKLKISPVISVICIAISSNLQGAATLVGDSTAIMLGGYAGLDFLDFFVLNGKPGMFVIVQISALLATLILAFVLRKEKQKISIESTTTVEDYFPTVLLVGMIALLIGASFIPNKLEITNGLICVGLLIIGIIYDIIRSKKFKVAVDTLKEIDFFTLLLLAGLFIVIAGIKQAGVVDEIAKLFVKLGNNNLFLMYTILVWFSVLVSAFIDNIPYIATMLPVTAGIATILGVNPLVLYFGLLSGATLGGNLTPIGASANITALGILRKEGHEVASSTFMKISVPFTLTAVMVGYILIWLIWAPNPFVFS
ncbi:MAG TPA: SLC13 family permease [Clostridia bacterium]|nr:SLC13 family permease [Clostridia bacterium]